MQTLVVDSSVIVKWLNLKNEESVDQADQILVDTKNGKVEIIAPELAKYEVANVLLKGKQLTPQQAGVSLETLYSLPITFIAETEDLAKETYALAFTGSITYYDAAFLSLARKYNALLITDNVKHQGKLAKVKVIALADYPS